MAVWSEVLLSELRGRKRLDAEYYQPLLLEYERKLRNASITIKPLGELVRNGHRVVYENTDIIEPEGNDPSKHYVRFLQATDINRTFPIINTQTMGWVSRNDWVRYPKGRVSHGELLIEVKGLASKVAIVPDDFPLDTLITGSVYKLQTRKDQLDPYFLLIYLQSKFGIGLRFRCLTNTLIGFVSKKELYEIPTPVPPLAVQHGIAELARDALAKHKRAATQISAAEARLMGALGLDKLDLSPSKCYTRSFHALDTGKRFGAEYYMPCKKRALDALAAGSHHLLAEHALAVREMWQPRAAHPNAPVRNFDLTDALEPALDETQPPTNASEIGSMKKRLRPGDVVISRLRSYLKEIALVHIPGYSAPGSADDIPAVGSSEFIVLRPQHGWLSAPALMVFLRCPAVQTILRWSQSGSAHPRFDERDLLAIPVPDRLLDVADEIDALVNEALTARREAADLLERAKRRVEELIGQ